MCFFTTISTPAQMIITTKKHSHKSYVLWQPRLRPPKTNSRDCGSPQGSNRLWQSESRDCGSPSNHGIGAELCDDDDDDLDDIANPIQ